MGTDRHEQRFPNLLYTTTIAAQCIMSSKTICTFSLATRLYFADQESLQTSVCSFLACTAIMGFH